MILKANWPEGFNVHAGTTLRSGGFSQGAFDSNNFSFSVGDNPLQVKKNRKQWQSLFDMPANIPNLQQVHGDQIVVLPSTINSPVADACYTLEKGQFCTVMTADCLPILLADQNNQFVAAIHGGWRSLAQDIIIKTLNLIKADLNKKHKKIDLCHINAWLGPAISQKNFTVGKEVRAAFIQQHEDNVCAFDIVREGFYQADLFKIATIALTRAGVNHIYSHYECTFEKKKLIIPTGEMVKPVGC